VLRPNTLLLEVSNDRNGAASANGAARLVGMRNESQSSAVASKPDRASGGYSVVAELPLEQT
jgi:hypothetical protein